MDITNSPENAKRDNTAVKNVLTVHRCRQATPLFGIQDALASNFTPDTRYLTNIYVFFLSTCTQIPGN
jgi:hypothetical protein